MATWMSTLTSDQNFKKLIPLLFQSRVADGSEKQVNIGRGVCVSSRGEWLGSVTYRWRVRAHDLVPLGFMRLGSSGREPWKWGSWDLSAVATDHREPVEGNSHYLCPLHLASKKTVKWHPRLIYWYLRCSVPICLLESYFAVQGTGSVPLEMLGRRQGLIKITLETPHPHPGILLRILENWIFSIIF